MEEKNKEMEESIIEWANFKFEVKNKEKWDIVLMNLKTIKRQVIY